VDLRFWVKTDRSTTIRVLDLVEAVLRDPLQGPANPSRCDICLQVVGQGALRREHRLVYRVSDARIDFLQARYHY
jgi:toxin YoeB